MRSYRCRGGMMSRRGISGAAWSVSGREERAEAAYQQILENENTYITLKFTSEGVEKIQHIKKTIN